MHGVSLTLVVLQATLATFLFFTSPGRVLHPAWVSAQAPGILLAWWAIHRMGYRKVKIFPEVNPAAVLHTRGAYRFIRHPMYAALLYVTLVWLMADPTGSRVTAWLGLLMVLLLKLQWEEAHLRKSFPGYPAYTRHTAMLLPFVF